MNMKQPTTVPPAPRRFASLLHHFLFVTQSFLASVALVLALMVVPVLMLEDSLPKRLEQMRAARNEYLLMAEQVESCTEPLFSKPCDKKYLYSFRHEGEFIQIASDLPQGTNRWALVRIKDGEKPQLIKTNLSASIPKKMEIEPWLGGASLLIFVGGIILLGRLLFSLKLKSYAASKGKLVAAELTQNDYHEALRQKIAEKYPQVSIEKAADTGTKYRVSILRYAFADEQGGEMLHFERMKSIKFEQFQQYETATILYDSSDTRKAFAYELSEYALPTGFSATGEIEIDVQKARTSWLIALAVAAIVIGLLWYRTSIILAS